MRDLLVLFVHNLPFLLQCVNEFLSLLIRKQELLFLPLIVFLNLHFLDQLVFVLDLPLDLLQIQRSLAIVLLLQEVLVLVHWQFRR